MIFCSLLMEFKTYRSPISASKFIGRLELTFVTFPRFKPLSSLLEFE
jgi:hypothetical protein